MTNSHAPILGLTFVLCCSLLFVTVFAYPKGAPVMACKTMKPGHYGTKTMDASTAPFDLQVFNNQLNGPERTATVSLTARTSDYPLIGFLLEARLSPIDIEQAAIGQFVFNNDTVAHTLDCPPGMRVGSIFVRFDECLIVGIGILQNAVTHSDASQPQTHVDYVWKAPDGFMGEIVFKATVVHEFHTYWMGVLSSPVQIN